MPSHTCNALTRKLAQFPRRGVARYVVVLENNWASRKQQTAVCTSSAEYESISTVTVVGLAAIQNITRKQIAFEHHKCFEAKSNNS